LAKGKNKGASGCDPCCSDPSTEAKKWQGGAKNEPYFQQDSYTNTVVKKGTVLYTLYPHGTNTPNYFSKAGQVLATRGQGARAYNDALQLAHKGNWASPKARDMRTQLHKFIVKEDVCMAVGKASANTNLGAGGGTQYFISDADKSKLMPTSMITTIK
jgi:hypothetical protein